MGGLGGEDCKRRLKRKIVVLSFETSPEPRATPGRKYARRRFQDQVTCSALHALNALFFFCKSGSSHIYVINILRKDAAYQRLPSSKQVPALRLDPHEIVTHPTKPVFVVAAEDRAVVGTNTALLYDMPLPPDHEEQGEYATRNQNECNEQHNKGGRKNEDVQRII